MSEIHARLHAALRGAPYMDVDNLPSAPQAPAPERTLHETAVPLPAGIHKTLYDALGGEPAMALSNDVHRQLAAALRG